MNTRGDVTRTIWRTVVFAGAMLGGACGGKTKADTTPKADPCAAGDGSGDATPGDGYGGETYEDNPCLGDERSRGVSDEGDVGRGFILS